MTTSTAIIKLLVRSTGLFVENTNLKDQNNGGNTRWKQFYMENETSKILWDFNIYTDWAIHHSRPNIVLIDKVDSRAKIIDTYV